MRTDQWTCLSMACIMCTTALLWCVRLPWGAMGILMEHWIWTLVQPSPRQRRQSYLAFCTIVQTNAGDHKEILAMYHTVADTAFGSNNGGAVSLSCLILNRNRCDTVWRHRGQAPDALHNKTEWTGRKEIFVEKEEKHEKREMRRRRGSRVEKEVGKKRMTPKQKA